jgi:hypothetical protein
MKDRFKFRAWDIRDKQIIYDIEDTYDSGYGEKGSYNHTNFDDILNDTDCVIMQSTGIKDINDKLIYEGDIIVDNDEYTAIIKWSDESARFYVDIFYDGETLGLEDLDSPKIIGNIYENENLLGE